MKSCATPAVESSKIQNGFDTAGMKQDDIARVLNVSQSGESRPLKESQY